MLNDPYKPGMICERGHPPDCQPFGMIRPTHVSKRFLCVLPSWRREGVFYSSRMGLDPAVLNAKPQNSPAAWQSRIVGSARRRGSSKLVLPANGSVTFRTMARASRMQ
jgi:hypothetical protein